MMGIITVEILYVQRNSCVIDKPLKKFFYQIKIEITYYLSFPFATEMQACISVANGNDK